MGIQILTNSCILQSCSLLSRVITVGVIWLAVLWWNWQWLYQHHHYFPGLMVSVCVPSSFNSDQHGSSVHRLGSHSSLYLYCICKYCMCCWVSLDLCGLCTVKSDVLDSSIRYLLLPHYIQVFAVLTIAMLWRGPHRVDTHGRGFWWAMWW